MSRRRTDAPLALTEHVHPRAEDLDLLPALDIVRRLHAEDREAVRAAGEVLPQIAAAAERVAEAIARGGRLFYVGAGTSGRLGVLDAAECPPTFGSDPRQIQALIAGGPAALTRAIEGAEDDRAAGTRALARHRLTPADVVCGISASATTPFVLGALSSARSAGAGTIFVCCNPAPARVKADVVIALETGPELLAGSTRLKAGTATKLVLNAVSTAAMIRLGKVYRGRMVDLRPTNRKLQARAKRMVAELTGLAPAKAAALLRRADQSPKLALAMHFTGLGAEEARVRVEREGLRALAGKRRAQQTSRVRGKR